MKFRMIRGRHSDTTGRYIKGDVIESDIDLAAKFNSPGSIKFVKVSDDTPATDPSAKKSDLPDVDSEDEGEIPAQYSNYTVAELRTIAEDEEIDLGGATKKSEIVAKLEEGMKLKQLV